MMKFLFWNVRGLGGADRKKQLVEVCQQQDVHVLCLQEVISKTFLPSELNRYSRGLDFHWSWVPSRGHSRGLLMGANKNLMEVC